MQRHNVVQQRALHQRARRAAAAVYCAGSAHGGLRRGLGRGQHGVGVVRRRQVRKRRKVVRELALEVRLVLRLQEPSAACHADIDQEEWFHKNLYLFVDFLTCFKKHGAAYECSRLGGAGRHSMALRKHSSSKLQL